MGEFFGYTNFYWFNWSRFPKRNESIYIAAKLDSIDENFMLKRQPGVFCAGEMLDWDAPTGGYLITTCMATGRMTGKRAVQFVCK